MKNQNNNILHQIEQVVKSRKEKMPESSYVAKLYRKDAPDSFLKKIAEEACEVVLAAKDENKAGIVHETADLLFHTLVMLGYYGVPLDDVFAELEKRFVEKPYR